MADNRAALWSMARSRRLFATTEATFGTLVKAVATDAFKALAGGGIETETPTRVPRDDNRSSRSREFNIKGNVPPVPWSSEAYLLSNGDPGSGGSGPPDQHPFYLAAMGTDSYTQAASTETYTLTDTAQNLGSLSLFEAYARGASTSKDMQHMHQLVGAWVDTMTIKGDGGNPPTVTFAGRGSKHLFTTRTTATGTPTTNTFPIAEAGNIKVDSVIAFLEAADGTTILPDPGAERTGDNDGAGFKVTALSAASGAATVTVEADPPSNLASGDIVAPWAPTETTAGDPFPGVDATFTIEGTTVSPLAYEFALDNGHGPHDNEAGQEFATGYHDGKRVLTGQITFRALRTAMDIIARRRNFANQTVVLALGTTPDLCTITLETELGFSSEERAADDTVICVLPFEGLATAANAKDELKSLVFS